VPILPGEYLLEDPPGGSMPPTGEVVMWIDPDGAVTFLSNQQTREVIVGMTGRGIPPIIYTEDAVPTMPGSRLRRERKDVRVVGVPMLFTGSSKFDVRSQLEYFSAVMDPDRGQGTLRIQRADGSQRDLFCRYASGLEGDESSGGPAHQLAVVHFRAFDPYWYDAAFNVVPFAAGLPPTFFPFFPLRLGSSSVFAESVVTNDGSVEAWPIWTITGPGDSLVLKNRTTGEQLNLATTIPAGSTVTIDTTPGVKTVTMNGTTNLYADLDFTSLVSALWSLRRGPNLVHIEMNSTTSASLVQLTYKRRYNAA
jgi:hypothetical protein